MCKLCRLLLTSHQWSQYAKRNPTDMMKPGRDLLESTSRLTFFFFFVGEPCWPESPYNHHLLNLVYSHFPVAGCVIFWKFMSLLWLQANIPWFCIWFLHFESFLRWWNWASKQLSPCIKPWELSYKHTH